MLFNSIEFIFFFLPITLVIFYQIAKWRAFRAATLFLFISSIFFYGYWKIDYIPLLIISISVNYFLGQAIQKCAPFSRNGRWLMILGIVFDLGTLVYYKYFEFITLNLNGIFDWDINQFNIILPLAISFYSFTQIAYLVDAYRGEAYAYSLEDYGLFIVFFPQLIAGPILRHQELIPELKSKRMFIFSNRSFCQGLVLFTLGLAKKVMIADELSPWVVSIFSNAQDNSMIEAWIGAIAYTLQLYFDFSGYSDMAVGLGRMFNVHIPINFNSPYKADSIADFWRRWHITLSNFLRDYLYIPMGGNRKGKLRQYGNLMITMLLGGLWHGAGWTFVIWGSIHGCYLICHRIWLQTKINIDAWLAKTITFIAVVSAWVVFRAENVSVAKNMLSSMFNPASLVLPRQFDAFLGWLSLAGVQFKGNSLSTALPAIPGESGFSKATNIGILLSLLLVVFLMPNTNEIVDRFRPKLIWSIPLGILVTWTLLSLNKASEFLYFQF